jgi:hypothetical protein
MGGRNLYSPSLHFRRVTVVLLPSLPLAWALLDHARDFEQAHVGADLPPSSRRI